MESIEYLTESVLLESLALKPSLAVMELRHNDDSQRTESWSGIIVSSVSAGVVSYSATGDISRRIERIQTTIILRGMAISDDPEFPAQRNALWRDITEAVLTPVIPAGKTRLEVFPSLEKLSFFQRLGESQSSREESDDRRSHQRTFEALVALRGVDA